MPTGSFLKNNDIVIFPFFSSIAFETFQTKVSKWFFMQWLLDIFQWVFQTLNFLYAHIKQVVS